MQTHGPENPFNLTPQDKVNFYIAHPDDEVMLIGAIKTCAELLRQNKLASLKVIVATNGEATTVNYLAPDNPDRKAEVTASLGKFGIGSARIEFLSLPDGGIDPSNPDIQQAIKQASLESTVAFTLGPQGGVGEHNDHSSLHETVLNVGQQTRTFVLNNHNQGTVQLQVTPDDRLAVLSAHPSQFQVVMGVQQGWQQIGKYSVGPETQKVLNEWDGLILNGSETYDIYQASSA